MDSAGPMGSDLRERQSLVHDLEHEGAHDRVCDARVGAVCPELEFRDDECWGGLDAMARPTGFRPGALRGRGGGFLSRSGARSIALEDAGGLAGFHRLMNRNHDLEMELQRIKGKKLIPSDVSTGSGAACNHQMGEVVRSMGSTQAARSNASMRNSLGTASVKPVVDPAVDGWEPAMGDAGDIARIQRLVIRNNALEMELQRFKGQNSTLLDTPDCSVDGNHHVEEPLYSKGGAQPVRCIAAEGKVQGAADSALAQLPVDDCRESELDFLPPVAGVGLNEYISAALSARKGSSKGKISGAEKSVQNLEPRTGLSVDDVDPFPPLSRFSAGVKGLEGDTASSRSSHGANLENLQGAREFAGLNLAEVHGADLDCLQGAGGIAGQKLAKGDEKNFTWKNLLRTNKPDDVCVDLRYVEPTIIDGEACAVFTLEEEAENMRQWQNTLLCYVVGKSPSYYQFLKAMQKQWNPSKGLEMFSRENGIFFCKFGSENDMKKVIKEGPWYLDGKLVVGKKFTGETNCDEEMLSSIPIWVKLLCLPVQWWSIEGVSKVVSPLGHPLYFDLPSASRSRIAYARCCVEVAMEKDLPSSVLCVGGDKVKKRQSITYDWVPKRCILCKEFGHVIAECGSSQLSQQQGKGGWINNNNKKGKVQQSYIPKAKNQIIEVEAQLETNAQKNGDDVGKGKQIMMNGGSNGAIYKTNLINNRMETIKASSANPYQLLANMEEDGTGDKLDGGNKSNHTYFCSDDEVDDVDDLAPRTEAQMKNIEDENAISTVDAKVCSAKPLVLDPCNEIEPVIVVGTLADDDPREREARGSGKEIEIEVPTNLGNIEGGDLDQENQGNDIETQESESETEEEETIRSYGEQPAERGKPPTLTMANPKYKGEIEVPKESKKEKKRTTPAPERPAGSRTTRHSFRMG